MSIYYEIIYLLIDICYSACLLTNEPYITGFKFLRMNFSWKKILMNFVFEIRRMVDETG